ncbi:MAG TPA: DNA methyltransferase [Methanothermobacter sp.]|nr:DNA modification methylase [Methanothermobacter sp. MT-2]HOK72504.1 DNA methyltransferase [Methanothermobacter sp.]HOL69433.1 DNA methyltransferase [Methanothermobacter sp.]HPQ03991.1 DNA methyltransferase [Methanothermobacter sp.]HPU37397.1 DNA methyltransferase [Methanothermobacter sp.]
MDHLERRAAAYLLRLAYRLISMYSIQGGTILDPFLGTGTTTIAAMCTSRNSIGYEINPKFKTTIESRIKMARKLSKKLIMERLEKHANFTQGKTQNTNQNITTSMS